MSDHSYQGFLDLELSQPTTRVFRLALAGDVAIPLGVALIPTGIFVLMGILMRNANQPPAQIPTWLAALVGMLQVTGMIAMAVVVLLRLEATRIRLTLMSQGSPARWRILSMFASIGSLTLFDIMFNVGGLFQGAIFLWYVAFPMFFLYLVMIQITFIGLQETTSSTWAE